MAIDTSVPRSRRALLAGGIGGLAAVVASALGRPLPTAAAEPYVELGQSNTASETTSIENTTTPAPAFKGRATQEDGLVGESAASGRSGVYGVTTSAGGFGVYGGGTGSYGALGGGSTGVRGASTPGTGVYGTSVSGAGVRGESTSGAGLEGASSSGNGVRAWSESNAAIAAWGKTGIGVAVWSVSGTAVAAWSETGTGVATWSKGSHGVQGCTYGSTGKAGVLGWSAYDTTGILGFSGGESGAPPDAPAKTGIYGYAAQDASARGVAGESVAGLGVHGVSSSGAGVYGSSTSFVGVHGLSTSNYRPAVLGYAFGPNSTTGVMGYSWDGVADVPFAPAKTGVYGCATRDSTARGVTGQSTAGYGVNGLATSGRGVHGQATTGYGVRGQATTGTAVYAATTDPMTGYALRAVGRVKLDKCAGVATIPAGASSVTVTPGIDLVSTSAVVASLQGNAGSATTTVSRCYVNVTTNTFTIYLTKAATQNVKVAWHVFG